MNKRKAFFESEMPLKRKYSAKSTTSVSAVAGTPSRGVKRFSFVRKKGAELTAKQRAEVRRIIEDGREVKVHSSASNDLLVDWGSSVGVNQLLDFNSLDVGVDINERIGNEINIKSAKLKFNIKASNTADEVFDILCVVIKNKYDPQSAVTSSQSDYKLSTGGTGQDIRSVTGVADMQLPWNGNKYSIFYEEIFQMRAPARVNDTIAGNQGDKTDFYRTVDLTKYIPKKISFSATGNGNSQVLSLLLIPLNSLTAEAAMFPTVTSTWQVEFTDA